MTTENALLKSKALEANRPKFKVEITIHPKYAVILDVMSGYYGIVEGVKQFLQEVSHPHPDWKVIMEGARSYSLDYLHLILKHEEGVKAAEAFFDIYFNGIEEKQTEFLLKSEAADNLLFFIQKIIQQSGPDLPKFMELLNKAFLRILNMPEKLFFLFVKSYFQIEKIAALLVEQGIFPENKEGGGGFRPINLLLIRYFENTYSYWLSEDNPLAWFEDEEDFPEWSDRYTEMLEFISHAKIEQLTHQLRIIRKKNNIWSKKALIDLLQLPGYNRFVDAYRNFPRKLYSSEPDSGVGNHRKIIFLFRIMSVSGLSAIHEEVLRDINRTVAWLIENEDPVKLRKVIETTFSILRERFDEYSETALNCILNMGRAVYRTDDSELVNFFIDALVRLGFQAPMIGGIGNDWQVRYNSAHIQNIRTWLELIALNPKGSTRLLSNLIIHLTLSGVFIKDTDLFPRDITTLLNSPIEPVYNLIKQLGRQFPVYFNDIGAEGELRDISTEIDEVANRKDYLVHFLRKQIHVESSNRIVPFMEGVIRFWDSGEKREIDDFVPPDILDQIDVDGKFVVGMRKICGELRRKGLDLPEGLTLRTFEDINGILSEIPDVSDLDRKRMVLAARLYRLLKEKYEFKQAYLKTQDIDRYLAQIENNTAADIEKLRTTLSTGDLKSKIHGLIEQLKALKKIILSSRVFEASEDIYKKRHITVDIPSMYGSYQEKKFDALGLTFRLESLLNVYLWDFVKGIDLAVVTKATLAEILEILIIFEKTLKLDGISSFELDGHLDLLINSLETRGFTYTQYLDIFRGFTRTVNNIINDYFNNLHEGNLSRILSVIPKSRILKRFLPPDSKNEPPNFEHTVSEIFFREKIAQSLGLQQLDALISRIQHTLFQQSAKLGERNLHQLLNYDPGRAIMSIQKSTSSNVSLVHLGKKGYNLLQLKNFGLPVPPGFIITTEVFRCQAVVRAYPPARKNFRERIRAHIAEIEEITGKKFGNPKNPLLFSVRSGSSISQPGMMDTFLNVGNNKEITEGLAKRMGNKWFAWDCYRRFLQCYGMSFGLKRDDFDGIISRYKQELGLPFKKQLTGDRMREVAFAYKDYIRDRNIPIEEDPFEQLMLTIWKVLESWNSEKAKTYRKIMGISNDWGTAVTVQSMVYGNLSQSSGTGVFFTHNPRWSGDILRLWGDFTLGNQGEDVVAGLVHTMPISRYQQEIEKRDTNMTLEDAFPENYKALKEWATNLVYREGWSPQEMEFTFESPHVKDLYLLQTRDMTIRKKKKALRFNPDQLSRKEEIGHGIGVSGGAMSGRIVFTLEEIEEWRKKEKHTKLILMRADTVPDDIREIFAADGLLTARGGLTSHAAVVTHRLEKTCVVGCADLICRERDKICVFDEIVLKNGDFISIDGYSGSVFKGRMDVLEA